MSLSNFPPPLILASSSPRRQDLLQLSGQPFTTASADLDEDALIREINATHPADSFFKRTSLIVMSLAGAKAAKILMENPDAVVIGADTIVTIDDTILGKPSSPEEAYDMLHRLSGREHQVLTGVSIRSREKSDTFLQSLESPSIPGMSGRKSGRVDILPRGCPWIKPVPMAFRIWVPCLSAKLKVITIP